MSTDIIDRINARIKRNQASDRELARITGQTVAEYDADTTAPDSANEEPLRTTERAIISIKEPDLLMRELETEARAKAAALYGEGVEISCSPTRWGLWIEVYSPDSSVIGEFEIEN